MSDPTFAVRLASGSFRRGVTPAFELPHAWTSNGVAVESDGTGAHLLHVAVGVCVLNDLYRESEGFGVTLDGVLVEVAGGFDDEWGSTGIEYDVEVDSPSEPASVGSLLDHVDGVAEIPKALRLASVVSWRANA
jgi:hypothetical protein